MPPSRYTRSTTHAYLPRSSVVSGRDLNVSAGSCSPTDVQFTSTSAPTGPSTAATPRSTASRRARSGDRFHTATAAPVERNAWAAARALPPAPRIIALRGTGSPSASSRPGASVLSARIAPSTPNVSVFAAPIARAAGDASPASASASSLCGIVTLTPANPAVASSPSVAASASGATATRS